MSKPNKSKTTDEHRDYFVHWERKLMRLCAVGMVSDGILKPREKEAIVDIIQRDINNKTRDYKQKMQESLDRASREHWTVSDEQLNLLNSKDRSLVESLLNSINKVERSDDLKELIRDYVDYIFFLLINPDDKNKDAQKGLFVDVGSKHLADRDALKEMRDIVYVIKADNVVAEVERMAFVSVAKVYKFSGVDGMWNIFFDMDKEFLLNDDEKSISRDMYVLRRAPINVHDVKVIERAITKSGMLGPLRYGLQSAIQRDKYDLIKHRERNRIHLSRLASVVFAISALLVFFECAVHLELKLFDKMPHHDFDPLGHNGGAIFAWILAGVCVWGAFRSVIRWYVRTRYNEQLFWRGWRRPKVKLVLQLSSVVLLAVFPICYWVFKIDFIDKIMYTCWSPLCVLCMMLSIEIMIFMRERYTKDNKNLSKHNTSSALLIIFVIAAVVADLCIGFIEIPYNEYGNFSIIAPKVAYSIFLGCLSFFAGKFMEMDAIQKHAEVIEMDGYIKNIKKHLDKSEN